VANLPGRFARIKRAVKRLDLSRPELEVACGISTVTREGDLRRPARKHVQDLSVYRNWLGVRDRMWWGGLTGDIAELVVVEHRFASIVTKHPPQIVLIPVLRKFRVGRSPHREGFT